MLLPTKKAKNMCLNVDQTMPAFPWDGPFDSIPEGYRYLGLCKLDMIWPKRSKKYKFSTELNFKYQFLLATHFQTTPPALHRPALPSSVGSRDKGEGAAAASLAAADIDLTAKKKLSGNGGFHKRGYPKIIHVHPFSWDFPLGTPILANLQMPKWPWNTPKNRILLQILPSFSLSLVFLSLSLQVDRLRQAAKESHGQQVEQRNDQHKHRKGHLAPPVLGTCEMGNGAHGAIRGPWGSKESTWATDVTTIHHVQHC